MQHLTGLALFTHDVRWLFGRFIDPPLISRSLQTEYCRNWDNNSNITVSTEAIYLYGDYEIVICDRHTAFISVKNLWTMTYLTVSIQEKVGIDEALKIAKKLIKNNRKFLELKVND